MRDADQSCSSGYIMMITIANDLCYADPPCYATEYNLSSLEAGYDGVTGDAAKLLTRHDVSATSRMRLSPDIHFGFGQTCESNRIEAERADQGTIFEAEFRYHSLVLTLANTLPLSIAIGTGPYALESVELLRLSPASQTYPLGIRTCSLSNLPLGVNTGTSASSVT